jgi:hypothetical protein
MIFYSKFIVGFLSFLLVCSNAIHAEVLLFNRTSNGNWDNVANYTPSRLPAAGDTVICETEIETTSSVFEGNLILRGQVVSGLEATINQPVLFSWKRYLHQIQYGWNRYGFRCPYSCKRPYISA